MRDSSFNCVCILEVSWTIHKKQIYADGLFGFLKQVGFLLRLLRLEFNIRTLGYIRKSIQTTIFDIRLTLEKAFKQLFFKSEIRSPKTRKLL